jgi:UrcA family protein
MNVYICAAVASSMFCVTAASAAETQTSQFPTARIIVHDIDMSTEAGQARLARRISRAAHGACDTVNPRFGPGVRRQQRACRDEIMLAAFAVASAIRDAKMAQR